MGSASSHSMGQNSSSQVTYLMQDTVQNVFIWTRRGCHRSLKFRQNVCRSHHDIQLLEGDGGSEPQRSLKAESTAHDKNAHTQWIYLPGPVLCTNTGWMANSSLDPGVGWQWDPAAHICGFEKSMEITGYTQGYLLNYNKLDNKVIY